MASSTAFEIAVSVKVFSVQAINSQTFGEFTVFVEDVVRKFITNVLASGFNGFL